MKISGVAGPLAALPWRGVAAAPATCPVALRARIRRCRLAHLCRPNSIVWSDLLFGLQSLTRWGLAGLWGSKLGYRR
jgi:hypothetical protein